MRKENSKRLRVPPRSHRHFFKAFAGEGAGAENKRALSAWFGIKVRRRVEVSPKKEGMNKFRAEALETDTY